MEMSAEALLRRFARLEAARAAWTPLWQDCADHLLPRRAGFAGPVTPGVRRSPALYDATAMQANELLAAGLHGLLTDPASRWFALRLAPGAGDGGAPDAATGTDMIPEGDPGADPATDPGGDPDGAARDWLAATEAALAGALAASNLTTQLHELYLGLGCYGTGCLYLEADAQGELRFSARDLAEIHVAEDAAGRIDTVFRRFSLSARQAVQAYGAGALPATIARAAREPQRAEERFGFLHAVLPRPRGGNAETGSGETGNGRAAALPFASLHVAIEDRALVAARGYHEFPFMVPRWSKAAGETYGRSPAMGVLADIRMLNEMCRTTLRAAQKAVDPPLLLPDEGFVGAVRMNPGGINYYRGTAREPVQAMPAGADIGLGLEMEERRRAAIRAAFFLDQLQLPAGPAMTATEVLQRSEEKLRLMGPMLGRLQDELLGPLIRRAYRLLRRAGRLPAPPPGLRGRLEVAYVSPLDRARRAEEAQAARRVVELLAPYVEADPGLLELVDGERLFRHVAALLGLPAGALRSPAEMAARRTRAAAAEAGAAALAELTAGAEAVATVVEAVKVEAK